MYLYNKTLVPGSNINSVATGNFLGNNNTQLVILRGTTLSIYNISEVKCHHLYSTPLFGIGRCISTLHLNNYYKDLLVLTSDSGNLTILEFNMDSRTFITLENYKIGKTGCSKSTPGQYLQISPDNKYIAIGSLFETILICPISYTLGKDRRSIQFALSHEVKTLPDCLLYDMAWSGDGSLYVYTTHIKSLQKSIMQVQPMGTSSIAVDLHQIHASVTRVCCYESNLFLLCEDSLLLYPSTRFPTNGLVTCFCRSDIGMIFGTDQGQLLCFSPEKHSFHTILPKFFHNEYATHLCCSSSTLFIFTNTGIHLSLPFSALPSDFTLPSSPSFHRSMISIGYCNHLIPIPSKQPIPKYFASIGNGSSARFTVINPGHTFDLTILNDRVFATNIFILPSLSNPLVDAFFVVSYKNSTSFCTIEQKDGNTAMQVVEPSMFILNKVSLNVGVHKGVYIQVTPTAVRAASMTEPLDTWSTPEDNPIESCYIGKNFIILVRKKYSIRCLRWEDNEFKAMEECINRSEITCVHEYNGCVLVGSVDRSIRVYQVENNALKEVSTCAIHSTPRSLFSFSAIHTAFSTTVSSNDSTLFVGCSDGELVLLAPQGDNALETIKTVVLDPTKDSISLSFTIINRTPALLMLSYAASYILYQNSAMEWYPVSIEMDSTKTPVDRVNQQNANTPSVFITYKINEYREQSFILRRNRVYSVKCDVSLPGGSYIHYDRPITCRSLRSIGHEVEILCGDMERDGTASNHLRTMSFTDNSYPGACVEYVNSQQGNESISTALVLKEVASKQQEAAQHVLIGSMTPNQFFVSYFQYNQTNNMTMKWKIPVEAKVFKALSIAPQVVALVIGSSLRMYKISDHGMSLISHVTCTSSFVTDIHYENNCFYVVDNAGVISIIFNVQNKLVYLLRHETHRSLMRSCVIDAISLAVSDKYGNILVYRSLFNMDYLLNTSDSQLQDDRLHATASVRDRDCFDLQMSLIASFYVGELVTSLFTETLKGVRVITYGTIYGTIGTLYPISNPNDLEILVALEALLMGKNISLVGRVVDDFRNTFIPSMSVVDGTICKLFFTLSKEEQQIIADQLEMSISEVKRKILEINNMETDLQREHIES